MTARAKGTTMDRREHGRDVSRWKDGEVPPGEAARIESHLAECEECRRAADVIDGRKY